jgi:hypothetical protein
MWCAVLQLCVAPNEKMVLRGRSQFVRPDIPEDYQAGAGDATFDVVFIVIVRSNLCWFPPEIARLARAALIRYVDSEAARSVSCKPLPINSLFIRRGRPVLSVAAICNSRSTK